jgi:t-SNARE complex subunit (syntaxin)
MRARIEQWKGLRELQIGGKRRSCDGMQNQAQIDSIDRNVSNYQSIVNQIERKHGA